MKRVEQPADELLSFVPIDWTRENGIVVNIPVRSLLGQSRSSGGAFKSKPVKHVDELEAFGRVVRHEAMHATIARYLGLQVPSVGVFGDFGLAWTELPTHSPEDCADSVCVLLSAVMIDQIFGFGICDSSGHQDDVDQIDAIRHRYSQLTSGRAMPDQTSRIRKDIWADPKFDGAYFSVCRLLQSKRVVNCSEIDAVIGFDPPRRNDDRDEETLKPRDQRLPVGC